MTIIEQARELLAFAQEDAPVVIDTKPHCMPPYILVDKAALANVCRALIARDEALRELVECDEIVKHGQHETGAKVKAGRWARAWDAARRALADDGLPRER